MQDQLLPLFPLAVVLLPDNELPLHIFEDRYKEMFDLVRKEQIEFGVVLASRDGIAATGCTASVAKIVKEYPDGRLDLVAIGHRRFVIRALDQERSFLRGEVEFFDDEDTAAPTDLRQRALQMCSDLPPERDSGDYDADAPQLSFLLARRIDDLELRQQLLMSRSETQRLRRLVDFIPAYAERVAQSNRMQELAPKNGHGRLPAGTIE
jgi:Lon protease-like protein